MSDIIVQHSNRQAIHAKILPPTETKGTRVKAWTASKDDAVILPFDYKYSAADNMKLAVAEIAANLDWDGEYIGAHDTHGGMTFVRVDTIAYRVGFDEYVDSLIEDGEIVEGCNDD